MQQPEATVCVVQPTGYVHALGLLDPARYLAHQLRRLGVPTALTKNRLRRGTVNYVFGAHLGLDPEATADCYRVLVNLEQLGPGGAELPRWYLGLLRDLPTVDYHLDNLAAYGADPATTPLLTFGHADYLAPADPVPLRERDIDLLFLGGINARRRDLIARIEATGRAVASFTAPVYGPERDAVVRRAKAVVNLSYYDTVRFEQVRAFLTLSCGTPLVSERRHDPAAAAFDDAVLWFDDDALEAFFTDYFGSDRFYTDAERALATFGRRDTLESVKAFWQVHATMADAPRAVSAPRRATTDVMRTGYREGWLHVSADPTHEPDLVLDLAVPLDLPRQVGSARHGTWTLAAGCLDELHLGALAPWTPGLATVMTNALALLAEDGTAHLRWPAGLGPGGLEVFTARFWEQGLLDERFDVVGYTAVDAAGTPCPTDAAFAQAVTLRKVTTSPWERTVARSHLQQFHYDA